MDTPRLIKQVKEYRTPQEPRYSFFPTHQSTFIEDSSSEANDSDVIEVSSEEENQVLKPKLIVASTNKIFHQSILDNHFKPSTNTQAEPPVNVDENVEVCLIHLLLVFNVENNI